jgi:hypothetical protein
MHEPPPSTIPRILPELTEVNRAFWTGGASGQLFVQHCDACVRWVHPTRADCPECGGTLAPKAVSGRASLFTYTVNHQPFHPDVPPPYVIAIVELAEQADLRVPANVVGCDLDALRCGMKLTVCFERHGEYEVPCFKPAD